MKEITVWIDSTILWKRTQWVDIWNTIGTVPNRESVTLKVADDYCDRLLSLIVSDRKEDSLELSKFISRHID